MQDRQSGKTRDLTEKFDRSVGSFTWDRWTRNHDFLTAEDHGESPASVGDSPRLGDRQCRRRFVAGPRQMTMLMISVLMSNAGSILHARCLSQRQTRFGSFDCRRLNSGWREPSVAVTAHERRAVVEDRHAAVGVVHIQRREQQGGSGVHGQAAGIRSGEKISSKIFDPRRAARGMGKRVVVSVEPGVVRGEWHTWW